MRSAILTLLLPLSLLAQTAAKKSEPPPTDPKDLCTVDGTVLNALTKEKLRKVVLTLKSPKSNYEATSDATGAFVFEKVEPGTYRLDADRAGFGHQWYGGKRPGQFGPPLPLVPAQKASALEIQMVPNGSITGEISDEDGDPVAGAALQVLRSNYNNGRMEITSWSYATADDEGVFKVASIAPGKYFLRATPAQRSYSEAAPKAAGAKVEQGYAATYFPGTMDLSTAGTVQVTAGQAAAGINIQLRKTAVYRVKGNIPAASLAGLQNVMVQAYRVETVASRGNMPRSTMRKPEGGFEFTGIPAGQYMLVLATYGGQPKIVGRQMINVANTDLEDVTIGSPATPIVLKGSIRAPGDNPPSLAGVRISVFSTEDPYSSGSAISKEDGSFFIPDLPPNKYLVSAFSFPEGTYLSTINSGDRDVTTAALDLDQASGEIPLSLTLGRSTSKLDGTVQDEKGQPIKGAVILVAPDPLGSELTRLRMGGSNTDKDGKFTVKVIAPGAYYVFAFEDFDGAGGDLNPDFLKKIQHKATKIEIKENATGHVEMKQITAAESEFARRQ